jgi:hypothetical protein
MEKTREIYTKIENRGEIIEILKQIKEKQEEIQKLFDTYDKLNIQENKIFENWNNNLDDVIDRLDHVTL